ncbi:hypothetical protein FJV41_20955 [Myxococcus llanfairpwllgwyngyllgogerychwyrndrobwllllantysiliogogogochensis]|uniref:Uncharacterized protein n=1 Tax=Myxococcus llanfairpwllgwyngyllgogerychwyrndrobwllllantysiliogogogochensis TaxID=2590453 RepID=A0A540WYB5_9BACT|nr:hypothetical protein [Myxococcus llanfairpwllgwyngyllgogerychwyrndrobwllllantysiliogogogochensis]TQF14002.1 hypothetical protein FJV41_20955 [Myxococcus llanfairpwllgwyngyllgogerychwyrndrobwllllantysiliogogogochensis]
MMLSILLAVSGCATSSEGSGGNVWLGHGAAPAQSESEMQRAAEAEVARVVEQVGAIVRDIDSVGARLTLTYWSERGALTWTGYESHGRVGHRGGLAGAADTRDALREVLAGYGLARTGQVVLSLRRAETKWSVDYAFHRDAERPLEARTLPVQWADDSGSDEVPSGLARLLAGVGVPNGGEAWLEADAVLDDGRVVGWELHRFQVVRSGAGGSPLAPASRVGREVVRLTRAFQDGIGPRTVRFGIRLMHSRGEGDGWVESARVVGFVPSTGLEPEVAAEYRAMHEDIVRRWREGVVEGFTWLAQRGVQELALWYVGAVAIRGAGFLAVRGGGVVWKALRQGKEAATGWLRTMLSRVTQSEGRTFERLWAKVQLEGERALTTGERSELRALMARIERLAGTPLESSEKTAIREQARRFYKSLNPRLERVMDIDPERWPVHHRRPLQCAHLFPAENINAASNLAVVERSVHLRINALWMQFGRARPHASSADVRKVAEIIDHEFQPWYHRVDDVLGRGRTPEEAETAVMTMLERLYGSMGKWGGR